MQEGKIVRVSEVKDLEDVKDDVDFTSVLLAVEYKYLKKLSGLVSDVFFAEIVV